MDIIAKRSDKVAFMSLAEDSDTYIRMRGFTEFSQSKNPVEYSRRYVDEKTERNDVVAYAPSISYSFDKFSDDVIHLELVNIADNELVGADAVKSVVSVDMSADGDEKPAICRKWTVIPDSEGNDNEAYTYSGTLKANGEAVLGKATSSDGWLTCAFKQS